MRSNCQDEEAGLLSYLQFYYCRLPDAKPFAFAVIVVWLGLLFSTIGIAASDFFCVNLSTIASILGMSESMAGVTFLAFGNGSPDVFSTFAAMKTHSGSLAVGELIGAAGFITAVVAGSMALVRPFRVARKSFVRDVGFFIVAASFSMVFLADGRLQLWECAVMVGFYIFYVIIVVAWHWYLRKRSQQKNLEAMARSHFHLPATDGIEAESYHDEEDGGVGRPNRGASRTRSGNDFASLERGASPMRKAMEEEADIDDELRDHYLAEIRNNMRVSRPKRGQRRNATNPIRPSLVGALEFRAVLSSLQKSKNISAAPINLRRYSDDPAQLLNQQQPISRRLTNPNLHSDRNAHNLAQDTQTRPGDEVQLTGPNRVRAVSANDITGLRRDSRPLEVPQIGFTAPSDVGEGRSAMPDPNLQGATPTVESLQSAAVTLSSPQTEYGHMALSPLLMSPRDRRGSADLLAPPGEYRPSLPGRYASHLEDHQASVQPESPLQKGSKPPVPKLQIPNSISSSQVSSPISPFPEYHDDPNFVPSVSRTSSSHLTPLSLGPDSPFNNIYLRGEDEKLIKWWPYKILPAPQVLVSTLLPTIYSWHDKNLWEKLLGIVASPSVFLLTITLPIVEMDKEDEVNAIVSPDPDLLTPDNGHSRPQPTLVTLASDSPGQEQSESQSDPPTIQKQSNRGIQSPLINITAPLESIEDEPPAFPATASSEAPRKNVHVPPSSPKEWNRWLVATQIFTAPLFTLFLVYANLEPSNPRRFVFPFLYTLIGCLVVCALLLLFTHPDRAPKYRYLLCFAGFVVAIAWISTIAGEVVGVLKALGIILNMSDAILGLTIFAVGNSLGDLVADITVARLGYPVMALSACFGGPMLNILLGIGVSGLYMTINGGKRRRHKHPDQPMKYKPYHIEIGGTLLISGVTLLVTLLGLLIVVPLRGWWMDRKVGWGLIVLWTLSTIGNVVVEILGWGGDIS